MGLASVVEASPLFMFPSFPNPTPVAMKLFIISIDTEQDSYEDNSFAEHVYMGTEEGVEALVKTMQDEIGTDGWVFYHPVGSPKVILEDLELYSGAGGRLGALKHR